MSEVTVYGEAIAEGWWRYQNDKRPDHPYVVYSLVRDNEPVLRLTASGDGLRVWSTGGGTPLANNDEIEMLNHMITLAHRQFDDRLYRELKPFPHAEDAELLKWLIACTKCE